MKTLSYLRGLSALVLLTAGLVACQFPVGVAEATQSPPEARAVALTLDGSATDWSSIAAGATATGQSVTEVKGCNDGSSFVYFLATGTGFGANYDLLINADGSATTGYQDPAGGASGADFLLENGTLYSFSGTGSAWTWTSKGTTGVTAVKSATVLEAKIARTALTGVVPASVSYRFIDVSSAWAQVSMLPKAGSAYAVVTTDSTSPPAATLVVDQAVGPYKTIAAGLAAATAGQTVQVHAGVYNETVNFPKSGTASAYIILKGDAGAILDGTGMSGATPLVTITGRSYVRLEGFEIRNLKPTSTSVDATGVLVSGACAGVQVVGNKVHDIWASSASSAVNAHGIHIAGNSNPGITNVLVSGNEIYNNKTGWSENLTVNGNVDGFEVSNNNIHDNNNIGIDCAGFYGMGPKGYDQARNGVVVGNTVTNITSINNPAYAGAKAADAIYVDGGKSITIERNRVDNSDIGIELASENKGKNTQDIVIRNNMVSRSYQGNIQAGGWNSNAGNAVNVTIVNNTTWGATGGEILIQYNCSTVTITNNVLVGLAGVPYLNQVGTNNTGFTVKNNLYYGASTTSPGSWADSAARYVNPLLVGAPSNLHLDASSPGKNVGIVANYGTLDFDGQARLNGTVDLGADEL